MTGTVARKLALMLGCAFSHAASATEAFQISCAVQAPLDEKEKTVTQSYCDAFGRAPDAGELAYWSDRIARDGMSLGLIVRRHMYWLVTDGRYQLPDVVRRTYREAFGREPGPSELKSWSETMMQLTPTFADVTYEHMRWITSTGHRQLPDLIRRAFAAACGREPSAAEESEWSERIGRERITYVQVVERLQGCASARQ